MKKNLSYELLTALQEYFVNGGGDKHLDNLGNFTDVAVGLNFLPFNPENIGKNRRKKTLQKYGFQSATELAEDFRKRILNDISPIPEHFERENIGYYYLFIAAYEPVCQRYYVFGIHCYNVSETFEVTYFDLDNDLTFNEQEDYYAESEYFSQAKGYRWLNPESDYYADILAWEALEKVVTEIYFHLEEKLDKKLDIQPFEKEKTPPATQEDLAKFLEFCGVKKTDIQDNVERLFSSLENFEMVENNEFQILERGLEVADFLRDYGNSFASDWKFEAEDLEYAVECLQKMEGWAWQYPENVYNADLFPSIRKELYRYKFWLCHFDEGNDGYLFLLFSQDDMLEIVQLTQKLQLPLRVFFR